MYDVVKKVPIPQSYRDVYLAVLIAMALAGYDMVIQQYLIELVRPLVLEMGFIFSLAVTCIYEFKRDTPLRHAFIGCLTNIILFTVAALVAEILRPEYLKFVASVLLDPTSHRILVEQFGPDFTSILSARYVGYGGCLALGLIASRVALGHFIRSSLDSALVHPENKLKVCDHCGNEYHKCKPETETEKLQTSQ